MFTIGGTLNVLVCYYSRSGNTKKMAHAIAEGVKNVGLEVDVKKVEEIKPADLLGYHGIIFGSPTYYGLMSAEMKKLIDESVKYHGQLSGKVGGAFTSSGSIGGGGETTILSILEAFLVHGMVVMGQSGTFHYGPVSIGEPNEKVIKLCIKYGEKLTLLTKKLFSE